MNTIDKHYITIQFKLQIYEKNGTEFQSFFESIMKKSFPDFQTIRPYGNKGDGGNDGYIKTSGIYYQVYSPLTPKINESKAAKKLKEDFYKLKDIWDKISQINEYNFVFNDKYNGSTQELEKTITELKKNNPNIEFKLLLAQDLENILLKYYEGKKVTI